MDEHGKDGVGFCKIGKGKVIMTIFAAIASCCLVVLSYQGRISMPHTMNYNPVENPVALPQHTDNYSFPDFSLSRRYSFQPQRDVLVFVHIQKTGGSVFGSHLIAHLNVSPICHCPLDRNTASFLDYITQKADSCICGSKRNPYLFTRQSSGWHCGTHPGISDLKNGCLANLYRKVKRRFLYFTILREPYQRYLSEWNQVRHARRPWPTRKLRCEDNLPSSTGNRCTGSWMGISLSAFFSCKYNLAGNRQVRMLSSDQGCSLAWDTTLVAQSADVLNNTYLANAKRNLESLHFFGIIAYKKETDYLFAKTFNVTFKGTFKIRPAKTNTTALTERQKMAIYRRNRLDIELYAFAKKLFFERVEYAKARDNIT